MGFYIDGPKKDKAGFLKKEYNCTEIKQPESLKDIPSNMGLICVIENDIFDGAAYVYDEQELLDLSDPTDPRPRTWLLMDKELAEELSGFRAAKGRR